MKLKTTLRGRFGATGFYLKTKIFLVNGLSSLNKDETTMIVFGLKKPNPNPNPNPPNLINSGNNGSNNSN